MISVITAHMPERKNLLLECYESLCAQEAEWEWLIQIDDPDEGLPRELLLDERISAENNSWRLGAPNTRNLALRRSGGDIIFSLDDDDKLFPGALQKLAKSLELLPAAIGNAYKDGQPWHSHGQKSDLLYPRGQDIPIGAVARNKEIYGTHCLPSCSVIWRREFLLDLGGWPALRGSEDTALLAVANSVSKIARPDIDVLHYRIHQGSESFADGVQEIREKNWEFIYQLLPPWLQDEIRVLKESQQ